MVDSGGSVKRLPKTAEGVPIYLHDYYGPGRTAKIVSTKTKELKSDGLAYREETQLTGDESRVAEVSGIEFPKLLDPIDDLPPTTVITHVRKLPDGKLLVQGSTADNGTVKRVVVNGTEARATLPNFAEWEVTVDGPGGPMRLQAQAEDAAGNIEPRPHVVSVKN